MLRVVLKPGYWLQDSLIRRRNLTAMRTGVTTVILRLHPEGGVLKGTMERPGHDEKVFRNLDEMLSVLGEWAEMNLQVGNACGSTSSSPILET